MKRIPNFAWMREKLSLFGVRETTQGRGSHGSLLLERKGTTRRQNTWQSLQSTESLPFAFLWEFLHQLGINEQEFYEQLT